MTSFRVVSCYLISGALLGIGFLVPAVWFLVLPGIVLQLYLISQVPAWQYVGSFIAWWIKFLFVLSFYWSIYPIEWLPFTFSPVVEWLLVGLYWVTVSLFLATGGLIFAVGFRFMSGAFRHTPWLGFLAVPILWVMSEIAGSYLLSFFTLGEGSSLNGYFSFGYIGLLLAEHTGLFQLSHVAGVYSMSFVAVMLGWGLVQCQSLVSGLLGRLVTLVTITTLVVGLSADLIPLGHTPMHQTVQVATINTNFPVATSFKRDNLSQQYAEQATALTAALASEPDYIITGEDERLLNQAGGIDRAKNYFQFRYASATKPIIIDSGRVNTTVGTVLQGIVYDSETNQHTVAHKRYLVPQGEFVPYFYDWAFRLFGLGTVMDGLRQVWSYQVGDKTSQVDFAPHIPGILFCFESSSALGVRDLVRERPQLPFIAHPVSHVWFNDSSVLRQQIESSLRIQASWNNVAIVSAGRYAPSQLFLPSGRVQTPTIIAAGEFWTVATLSVPLRK
jgi:apolipoprotein N-acyltransferase